MLLKYFQKLVNTYLNRKKNSFFSYKIKYLKVYNKQNLSLVYVLCIDKFKLSYEQYYEIAAL